jgi:hypothetical protein
MRPRAVGDSDISCSFESMIISKNGLILWAAQYHFSVSAPQKLSKSTRRLTHSHTSVNLPATAAVIGKDGHRLCPLYPGSDPALFQHIDEQVLCWCFPK